VVAFVVRCEFLVPCAVYAGAKPSQVSPTTDPKRASSDFPGSVENARERWEEAAGPGTAKEQ